MLIWTDLHHAVGNGLNLSNAENAFQNPAGVAWFVFHKDPQENGLSVYLIKPRKCRLIGGAHPCELMKSFNYKIYFKRNELLCGSIDKKKQAGKELASSRPEGGRLNEQMRVINGMLGVYKCF